MTQTMDDHRTDDTESEVAARADARRAIAKVVQLSIFLMLVAAIFVTISGDATSAMLPAPWWVAVAIAVLYGLTECYPFHVEYRREAMSHTFSELPTVFALAFLGPVVAILARSIGSMLVMVFRRPKAYKSFFNIGLFSFETALAFAVVRYVVDLNDFDAVLFLFAVAAGTGAATVIGSLALSAAISMFESNLKELTIDALRTTGFVGPFAGTVAAVAVAPALVGPAALILSVVPVVGIWLVLLRLGRVGQSHRNLEAMHGFASLVGQSLDTDEVAATALDEAAQLIRAGSGLIQAYDDAGTIIVEHRAGSALPAGPTDTSDQRWGAVFQASGAAYAGADFESEGIFVGHHDMIAAPIRDDRGVLGLLVLASRQGVHARFDDHDLARMTTLTAHIATSLRKTMLHASMEHAAMHDSLTGHLNRGAFDHAVTNALTAQRPGECAAVLMLDLDQFKEVNDTLGHHVGDAVLVEFARRVEGLLDPNDVFARFGGDEFALFVRRSSLASVRDFADQVLSASYQPLRLDGTDIVVAVSVGIAAVTDDDRDATAVLRRADIAMYTAKRQHAGLEVYSEEIDRRTPERLSLFGDLRAALEGDAIEVHYQPKIDLATSTVTGFEALARWNHPTRGWVSPDEFIPIAEETGLIKQLTDQVLSAALRATRRWRDAGLDLGVAVNLSTLDLLDELLAERLAHRLEQHGLLPEHLTLEITESSLMADTPRTMHTVAQLDQLGVGLSLDDFGTGYSSLSYLRRLPVAELKIDRSFVANIMLEPQDEMIVRSTIDLGHNLGLHVVAEGIENAAVLARLLSLGCDIGQGYGISRPLSEEFVNTWLSTTELEVRRVVSSPTACAQSATPRRTDRPLSTSKTASSLTT